MSYTIDATSAKGTDYPSKAYDSSPHILVFGYRSHFFLAMLLFIFILLVILILIAPWYLIVSFVTNFNN